MRCVQLVGYNLPLQIRRVPVPKPRGGNVLIRIAGSGLCHSDLMALEGSWPMPYLPFTLGHENAGYVEEIGENVTSFKKGDPVAVFGGWSDRPDRFTYSGDEHLSNISSWVGIGQTGGNAEYLLVPTHRYLVPLGRLDPVEACVLTDAALTPFRAVKKLLPNQFPGSLIVIIGIGGLGQFAVRYASLLTQSTVVAVDIDQRKLDIAKELGANFTVNSRSGNDGSLEKIKDVCGPDGANGVIDFVGTDATLKLAYEIAGKKAKIVIAGLSGGTLPYDTFHRMTEIEVTTTAWGNLSELYEVVRIAQRGLIKPRVERIGFEEMNESFDRLKRGEILGRAVLEPSRS
jgi:alcohol dehydrogenase, propanol-preferring